MKRAMKPIHPGAIFREDILKELNLTVTDAARALAVSRKQLSEIINERAAITAEMAVRMQQVFGVAAEFWLDLQKKHEVYLVEQSGKIRLKRIKMRKSVAA
jgi:addiction module HigA family antidote